MDDSSGPWAPARAVLPPWRPARSGTLLGLGGRPAADAGLLVGRHAERRTRSRPSARASTRRPTTPARAAASTPRTCRRASGGFEERDARAPSARCAAGCRSASTSASASSASTGRACRWRPGRASSTSGRAAGIPAILDVLGLEPAQLGPIVDLDRPFHGLRPEFAGRWPALARVPVAPGAGRRRVLERRVPAARRPTGPPSWSGRPGRCAFASPPSRWRSRRASGATGSTAGASSSADRSRTAGASTRGSRDPAACRRPESVERELHAMPPDAHGLTVLPFLAGERSVGWVAAARAAVVGLSLATRPIDILRAGLETVAYRFALIHARLREACPASARVVATGGALSWPRRPGRRSWRTRSACPSRRPRRPRARAAARRSWRARRSGSSRRSTPCRRARGRRSSPIPLRHARYRAGLARHRALYDAPDPPRDRREESAVMTGRDLDQLCVNTIRFLAADAVQQAKSGHPGLPMGAAPMAYVLWTRFLRHHPADPAWPDRDRFVLSAGHGSMLLYALLHLTGYDLPLEELKRFRQWGSQDAGAPGVRAHRRASRRPPGPLGQGLANAVGMAIAERHLAQRFNRPGHTVVDHHTYVHLLRRRPDGGRGGGGVVACRPPRARQADRPLRRQPDLARRQGGPLVLGGRPAALRRARLAHPGACPTATTSTRSTRPSAPRGRRRGARP